MPIPAQTLRRVLFIAYNFPPHGGAGVQRSLKFVKYLPQFGWQPLVVTTTAEASPVQDPTLLQDIPPHTPITRIPGFSIFQLQQQAQKYRLHRLAVLLNVLLQIPDPTRFWAKKIQPTLDDLIRQHQPQLIYTTSGPYSAHLAGRWLRQRTNLPWLADFRDPWSQNLLMPYAPGYRTLNARLEQQVLATADKITCVSRPWLNDLQQNLGHSAEKFAVLPNGYDETDLETSPLPASGERFILTHIGSFYRNRRPDELIQAVEQLVAHGRVPAEKLLIRFIGKNAQRFAPDHPSFEAIDYVPHKELARYRRETHALLLILATTADNLGNYSGKIYEYIASNRPILAIVPPGGVAEQLIHQTQTGLTTHGRAEHIANALETLYNQWQNGHTDWQPNWSEIQKYTRRNLTQQLAATFDEMTTTS